MITKNAATALFDEYISDYGIDTTFSLTIEPGLKGAFILRPVSPQERPRHENQQTLGVSVSPQEAPEPRDPIEAAIQALKDAAYDINLGRAARRGSIDLARKAGHTWMNLEHAVAYITDCDYMHTTERIRKEAQKDIAYIEAEEENELMTPARG